MTVRACKCANEFQDKTYGKGMRVHTPSNKGDRCTVCNNVVGDSTGGKRK